VEDWLTRYGLQVVSADPESSVRSIRLKGTAAQVESALSVQIWVSRDGKWFSIMSAPQIPANLQGIAEDIQGLNNLIGYADINQQIM
jgi:hypothetical protein